MVTVVVQGAGASGAHRPVMVHNRRYFPGEVGAMSASSPQLCVSCPRCRTLLARPGLHPTFFCPCGALLSIGSAPMLTSSASASGASMGASGAGAPTVEGRLHAAIRRLPPDDPRRSFLEMVLLMAPRRPDGTVDVSNAVVAQSSVVADALDTVLKSPPLHRVLPNAGTSNTALLLAPLAGMDGYSWSHIFFRIPFDLDLGVRWFVSTLAGSGLTFFSLISSEVRFACALVVVGPQHLHGTLAVIRTAS